MERLDNIEPKDYTAMNLLAQWANDKKEVEEETRKLHERINKLELALRILCNDLSVRVIALEKIEIDNKLWIKGIELRVDRLEKSKNNNPTRRQLSS